MKSIITIWVVALLSGSAIAEDKKPEVRVRDLERRIHDFVNDARKANGQIPLQLDEKLSAVARAHSEDMAKAGYFDHKDPAGRSVRQRVESAGIACTVVGENLYQNNLYIRVLIENGRKTYDWSTMDQIASTTVKGWMNSPGHRQNIVSTAYKRGGMGAAIAKDDKVYITQVFCD
jgi:uncharacterized protein YkwD